MWVVGRLHKEVPTNIGIRINMTDDKEIAGFLMVFKTKKAALKHAGKNAVIYQLEARKERGE